MNKEQLLNYIKSGHIVRVDSEGEHIESVSELLKSGSFTDILKLLNRNIDDLVSFYDKTQNSKVLNDIALAVIANKLYDSVEQVQAEPAKSVQKPETVNTKTIDDISNVTEQIQQPIRKKGYPTAQPDILKSSKLSLQDSDIVI